MAPCCWDELLDMCDTTVSQHGQCRRMSTSSKIACPCIESLIPLVQSHVKSSDSGLTPQLSLSSAEKAASFFQESVRKPHVHENGVQITGG
jgi:hypothetical protein